MQLRDYQTEAIAAVRADWSAGYTDTLLVAATGAGKTQMFLALVMAELDADPSNRALCLAHRQELIEQPLGRVRQMDPDWLLRGVLERPRVGVVMNVQRDTDRQLTIATVQSLNAQRVAELLAHGPITHLITDECHHATAPTYVRIYEALKAANPGLKHLGVTATPLRADGDGLARVYQKDSARITIADLVHRHYLVQPRWLGIATGISLKGVKTSAGDYQASQLAERFDTARGRQIIVQAYQQYGAGRRAIAFTASVAGAHDLAAAFRDVGITAAAIDGTTDKDVRRRILDDFRAGRVQIVTNCQVLTEGFDAPGTSCILMCRPTRSDSLYVQCLDLDTEVLTEQGWRRHDTLQPTDRVAGFDPQTGEVRWVGIDSTVKRSLAPGEQMYALQSPTIDLRVTGGHRMLMRHRRSPEPAWRFMTAERLAQKQSEYLIPVAGGQVAPGVSLSDDELRFIGLWLADGSKGGPDNRQVSISQAVHHDTNEEIERILRSCGFDFHVWDHDRPTEFNAGSALRRYTMRRGRGADALAHLDPYLDKNLSAAFEDMSGYQLGLVLEGLHLGDGIKERNVSWTRQTYHIVTGNLEFAERLQSLCVRRGFRCNLAPRTAPNGNAAYCLHIKYERFRYVGGAGQEDRPTLQPVEALPDEQVWCLSNELQTLIVRRNGKVAVVGNCMGRGLRPAGGDPSRPGMAMPGEDCLILDFLPAESRNIVMAGDVLGLPKETTRTVLKEQEAAEEGAVQAGFTFDGETFDANGTPMEIIGRELNYLDQSPYVWHRRDGLLTLGCGAGSDRVERILAIRGAELWGVWRRVPDDGQYPGQWQARRIPCDDPLARGAELADKHASGALVAKGRGWHTMPASEGQISYLRKLARGQFSRAELDAMTKGAAASLITHYQALQAIARLETSLQTGVVQEVSHADAA